MFAVMKTGGKQYKVQSGDVLRVERLAAEAGDTVQFNDILMIDGTIGTPMIEGAAVQAEIIDQIKGDKVIHFVKRRRKHSSKRTKGHRQKLTLVRITDIMASGGDKSGVMAAIGTGSVGAVALAATAAKTKPAAKKADKADKPAKAPAPKKEAAPKKAAAPKADAKADSKAEVEAAGGVKPANLLTAARDGGADDLKRISGVGPKLEGTLHEIGVYHFDQIAAWGADEIAYMDDRLSFKGRIERDNWIAQAAEFAAEKE